MPGLRRLIVYVSLLLLGTAATATATQQDAAPSTYAVAALAPIAIQPGVSMHDDYVAGLRGQVVNGLEASKHFKQVVQGDGSTSGQGTLKIQCTVTKFVQGSRTERYFVLGTGATKLSVHVAFVDAATGKVLLEQDVNGSVHLGVGGGNSAGAQKTIAKDIEGIIEKHF